MGIGIVDASLHLLADALFGRAAVERVVDAHPVYGEESVLAEVFVSECFLCDVADLDVERHHVQALGQSVEHLAEEVVLAVCGRSGALSVSLWLGIVALAEHAAVHEEERWQHGCPVAHDGQQLAHHAPLFVAADYHVGFHPGRGGTHLHQLSAVEEVALTDGRQFVRLGVYLRLNPFHAAKIQTFCQNSKQLAVIRQKKDGISLFCARVFVTLPTINHQMNNNYLKGNRYDFI